MAVTINGSTGVQLEDNDKQQFGTGDDLKIYHDGSNSFIADTGTGGLILRSQDLTIQGNDTTENLARFIENGAVELYHNNEKKLDTYSGGSKITGYLHAYEDESDSDHGISATKHVIQQSTGNQAACVIEHTANTNAYGLYIDFSDASPDDSTKWFLSCDDSSANRLKILSSGDITTSDGGTLNSDETLKENIVDATPKLEDIKKLKVRNFNWKSSYHPEESKRKHIGFFAQEVEQVFPGLVQEYDIAPGDTKADHTPVMKKGIKQAWGPILVKALQEAVTKIETLETKVAALEAHTHE